jgi:HlyD family secretion protein
LLIALEAIRLKRAAAIIAACILVIGYIHYLRSSHLAQEVNYISARVEKGKLLQVVSASGKLRAVSTVSVGSEVSGRIEKVLVDFNDEVIAGQTLARLDQHRFVAKLDGARAALERAKANVKIRQAGVEKAKSMLAHQKAQLAVLEARIDRAKGASDEAEKALERKTTLISKGVVSDEDLDQVRSAFTIMNADLHAARAEKEAQHQRITTAIAELRQAEAEVLNAQAFVPQEQATVDLAEVELERTIIRSPIDGVVLERLIEPGQTVAASFEAPELFSIAQDLSRMEVHASINEADIGQVRVGQAARFTVDAYPERVFEGNVAQVRMSPETDGNVVTYKTILSADNSDLLLLPGMTASVRIVVMESAEVVKIPLAALRYSFQGAEFSSTVEDGGSFNQTPDGDLGTVWKLEDSGRPVAVTVELGDSDLESRALISGPVTLGDDLVVSEVHAEKSGRLLGFRVGF